MKILLLDNYDSFTWNLVQLLREAGASTIEVIKNDHYTATAAGAADAIVISPGPGLPSEAGNTCALIREWAGLKKMLGVCLGMQAMAEVYGGRLYQPGNILHGETVKVTPLPPADPLFACMKTGFNAGLYHSWAVASPLPACLRITSTDSRGVIMSLRHKEFDLCGVQFHPESVMTPQGLRMMRNWLES